MNKYFWSNKVIFERVVIMNSYNLSLYDSNGNVKTLNQQLSDVKAYITNISTNMKNIQKSASSFADLLSITSQQTSTVIPNLVTSVDKFDGLNGDIRDFLANWSNNQALLNTDLSNLSSWVTGNWGNYVTSLNKSLNVVTSILSKISSANSNVGKVVVGKDGSTIKQFLSSGVSTITADQANISKDINDWMDYYAVLSSGCIGDNSSTQDLIVPKSTASQELDNITPAMTPTVVSVNGLKYSCTDIQDYVNKLTAVDPSSMNKDNYIKFYNLSAQFAAWESYILPAFNSAISSIKKDISDYHSGVSGSLVTLNYDMDVFLRYVNMLKQLTGYWNGLINQALSYITLMKESLKSLSVDVNKLVQDLSKIVNVLNGVTSSSAKNLGFEIDKINQNLRSYSSQLQELAFGNSGESSGLPWYEIGILTGIGLLIMMLSKSR